MARQSSKSSAPPAIRLTLLGTFCVERDGKPLALYSRKVESLLAYLVLHPQEHAREKLAALFWGDSNDEQARASLRVGLNDLRKKLGDDIVLADRETVQLNSVIPLWVDTKQISDLRFSIADLEIENLKSKIENYHGDLLADFYDDWIPPLRDEYRELYLTALFRLIDHARAQSEYAQVVELGRRALATDPANETAHQHLIFAYAAQGDRTAALDQYAACERALRDELGVAPSKETRALYESIKQKGASPSAAARLTNLPKPLTSFVGREKEIEEIKRLMATNSLVTLIGAGGSGKTRLSIELGRTLVNQYPAGVWWVDLSPLADAARVADTVAKSLGVQEQPHQPMMETLVNFLQAKQLLLVIDNCEHLIAACAILIQTLLSQCENVRVLATSREALSIPGEKVYSVPSLGLPVAEDAASALRELEAAIAKLLSYEAVRLFVERAKSQATGFALTDRNASHVIRICQRLDGIPLAIELAAARMNALSAEEIARRLDDRFRLLTSGSRTALPRQQTLRALIDWSYDLLTEPERVLFRRLAVFASGWTLQTAEEVCSDQDSSTDHCLLFTDILELLTRLVDKSLVIFEQDDGTARYRMLDTMREYAREKLVAANEEPIVKDRHLDYYLQLAHDAETKLHGSAELEWLERLDLEHDNIRAALDWSLGEGRVERGARLACSLWYFWFARGYWREGRERAEDLLAQAETIATPLARANGLFVAGTMSFGLGDYSASRRYLEDFVALAREQKELDKLLALGLGHLGSAIFGDDPTGALALVEEGLTIARALGDQWVVARLLMTKSDFLRGIGKYSEAMQVNEEGRAICRAIGDVHEAARFSSTLQSVRIIRGDWGTARQELEPLLPIFRQTKEELRYVATLLSLGEVARLDGNYGTAKKYYSESLERARSSGLNYQIVLNANNLGFIALHEGDVPLAQTLFAECLTLSQRNNMRAQIYFALFGFAGVWAVKQVPPRAISLLAAFKNFIESGDRRSYTPVDEQEYQHYLAMARAQLDDTAFNTAWEAGRALTLEQAIALALEG